MDDIIPLNWQMWMFLNDELKFDFVEEKLRDPYLERDSNNVIWIQGGVNKLYF